MKTKSPITEQQKRTARIAKALGHPVRVYIVELLANASCCYSGDLSEVLPIAKSTLSQHLKELREAGIIQGQTDPPKIRYCLNKDSWNETQELFKHLLNL